MTSRAGDDSLEASVLRGGLGPRELAGDTAVLLELLRLGAEFRRQRAQPAGQRKVEGGAREMEQGFRLPEQSNSRSWPLFPPQWRGFLCVIYRDVKPGRGGCVPRWIPKFPVISQGWRGKWRRGAEWRRHRRALGVLPSPSCGEGWGGGWWRWRTRSRPTTTTPLPTPPPQGGREQTEFAARAIADLAMDRRVKPGDDSVYWAAMRQSGKASANGDDVCWR